MEQKYLEIINKFGFFGMMKQTRSQNKWISTNSIGQYHLKLSQKPPLVPTGLSGVE